MGCGSSKPEAGGSGGLNVIDSATAAPPQHVAFKLVMMGDKSTGKSSIVVRFTKDQFPDNMTTTIGAAFASKDVRVEDGTLCRLQIWDTAGEEMYRAMTRSFFREAAAGIIVYDITSSTSFEHVKSWLDEFKGACPDSPAILVGNKVDMGDHRRVTTERGMALAHEHGMEFFECSAKAGIRVGEVFQYIARDLVASKKKNSGGGGGGGAIGKGDAGRGGGGFSW